MLDDTLDDEEFGEIEVRVNPRARCLRLRYSDGHFCASVPPSTSEQKLRLFIDEVRQKLRKIVERAESEAAKLIINEQHTLQTLSFGTQLSRSDSRKAIHYSLSNGILHIEVPARIDISNSQTQRVIKAGIEHFLRIEAKRLLPPRLQTLASRWSFQFADVKIQSSKTRWGSCNSHRNINLSFYLLLLPPHLIDYVLLHELCHTVEMNHGPRFWTLMDKVTQNQARQLRNEIRQHRCRL